MSDIEETPENEIENEAEADTPKRKSGRSRKPKMYFSTGPVKITPQMAREMLAIPPVRPPRSPRSLNLAKISHALENGDWKVNHHAIALAPDGSVLDGRHRLTVCAGQRKALWTYIAYDVDPDLYDTMDNGASRSPGDTLKTAGYTDTNVRSAAIRMFLAYELLVGTESTTGAATNKVTNTDIKKAQEYPDIGKHIDYAIPLSTSIAAGIHRPGVRTSITALIALISRYSEYGDDAQVEFFERLKDGTMIEATSPIHHFREWVKSDEAKWGHKVTSGTYQRTAFMAMGIRAWNGYVNGEEWTKKPQYVATRTTMPEIA